MGGWEPDSTESNVLGGVGMPRAPQGFHLLTAETEAIGGGFGRGKGRTDNPGKIPPCVSRWGRGSDTATYRSCSSTSSTLLEEYDPN